MNSNDEDQAFEELLEFLSRARGFDFTGYKRSNLKRRVRKQMQLREIDTFEAYLDYLQIYQQEFQLLFNTILINVTTFFRDRPAWNYLQEQTIPTLINNKSKQSSIRIWSVGCASGEEAYTLAILFAEYLGLESFRQRVKIYATDLDEEALNQARQASYSLQQLEPVDPELRDKFFDLVGNRYIFRPDLRRAIIFGRHDLVQDAPISRLDLLVCRNTLMYFNAETQAKILNRFHFALNSSGFLFLGKAEMLLTHAHLFTPVSLQNRIFRQLKTGRRKDRPTALSQKNLFGEEINNNFNLNLQLRELAFDNCVDAQIVIDHHGNLILANLAAREQFGIDYFALGHPLQDLEISYRPLELRSHIERVYQKRQLIIVKDVIRKLDSDLVKYLNVHFFPLKEEGSDEVFGVSILFIDVTRYHELEDELQQANQKLETANQELQSSNEELETTNEELQSTNEELETTNEELQSTNEELETMNEELQSTNEELQTINDELRQRTNELNQANSFLNSILTSVHSGVIVVDSQYNILGWNKEAENLWGLRADEVREQSLLNLDIGLSVAQLREPIRRCLNQTKKNEAIVLEAINRRGKSIRCQITFNPLIGITQELLGVIMMIDEFLS